MSCTTTPTATEYATISTYTPSTSYSQSTANDQSLVTTVVSQSCVASGSDSGCISSAAVTQVNTLAGGNQAVQVPVVITVPIAQTTPTNTLFATDCSSTGGSQSEDQPSSATPTPTDAFLTTSFLVQSTPPPSTLVEASSATLADGSVVQTVVTFVSTLPATSVYEPSMVPNPTLQADGSGGSGTNVAPIVGGVLGGFLGIIAIVGSLWWLCRKRRSWDDIFGREAFQDEDPYATPIPVRRARDRSKLDLSVEPKPYQYGLVGRVVAPVASGSPPGSPRPSLALNRPSLAIAHGRDALMSSGPLVQATPGKSSRPSTAGSMQTLYTQPSHRAFGTTSSSEMGPRSLSMISSHSTSSSAPLIDARPVQSLVSLNTWRPNADGLGNLEPLHRSGSPVLAAERRILQVANNDPPSPTATVVPSNSLPLKAAVPQRAAGSVLVHTDAGRISEFAGSARAPPAYSR
ncbi:hypothetical protein F5I97DRAFT_538848 [Phlebopus sp. FC_14]|nr:hypothetical protein F5I97DRAFT_538848 [Phlebopus sp. FC_14]